MSTLLWAGAGAVLAAVYLAYARARHRQSKRVFGIGLLIAALIYLAFVSRAQDPFIWVGVEAVGAALFGLMALLGWRGSDWWLAAGWAVHPVWDIGLHYIGPGGSFVPAWYAIACASFDWLVAAYIASALLKSPR